MKFTHHKLILAVLNIFTLSLLIISVSIFFINNSKWIGPILIILAILSLASLIPFKIKIKSALPDITFGLIDNSILAILAIFGGYYAGVSGAIIGGVVGNAITDGIAGIFEGKMAEKLRSMLIHEERTMLKSAVGKIAGCLFGAGIILTIASIIRF